MSANSYANSTRKSFIITNTSQLSFVTHNAYGYYQTLTGADRCSKAQTTLQEALIRKLATLP